MSDSRFPVMVYSKPNCVQCIATYRFMESHGIPYHAIDVDEDAIALQKVQQLGYQAVPVVIVPPSWGALSGNHWYGFQPDLLRELIAEEAA